MPKARPLRFLRMRMSLNQSAGVPAAQRMALALAKAGVPLRFDGLYTVESLADELVDLLIGRSGGPSNVADIANSKTVAREEGC